VALESPTREPGFVTASAGHDPAYPTLSHRMGSSRELDRHGPCVDLALSPALGLRSHQAVSAPAPPLPAVVTREIRGNGDRRPKLWQRAEASPSGLAGIRTTVLRC
jgi:hypothetical protein